MKEIVEDTSLVPKNIEIICLPTTFVTLRKKLNNILDNVFIKYPSCESIDEENEEIEEDNAEVFYEYLNREIKD